MATKKIILTSVPTQITSGTEIAYISSNDNFYFADADVMPIDLSAYHMEKKVSAYPPFKLWLWSNVPGVKVNVSKRPG